MAINKVIYGGTTLIDLSGDSLASADQLMQGVTAHDRTGALITGTATGGGGGSVTQDQDGYIVLPPDGGGGGGGSGLVFETGIYEPTAATAQPTITFTDTHTTRPYSIIIEDVTGTNTTTNTVMFWTVISWYDAFGTPAISTKGGYCYGGLRWGYGASNGFAANGGNINSETAFATYMTPEHFIPYCNSSSFVYGAGRTYKWIAVWKPTT